MLTHRKPSAKLPGGLSPHYSLPHMHTLLCVGHDDDCNGDDDDDDDDKIIHVWPLAYNI